MKLLPLLGVFLSSFSLEATYLSPWLRNVFELDARASVGVKHHDRVQTPLGSFNEEHHYYPFAEFSLGAGAWPSYDFEAEGYFSETIDQHFEFEAFLFTLRHSLVDDVSGDPFSLVAGATLSFPQSDFLKDLNHPYHGNINGEIHLAIGKSLFDPSNDLWLCRCWALAGWGVANKGNSWIHYIAAGECLLRCIQVGLFSEGLFGLGSQDIDPLTSFDGYAAISHRAVDLGFYLTYPLGFFGSLTFQGFYNVYAHNFPIHSYGARVDLTIPFSF